MKIDLTRKLFESWLEFYSNNDTICIGVMKGSTNLDTPLTEWITRFVFKNIEYTVDVDDSDTILYILDSNKLVCIIQNEEWMKDFNRSCLDLYEDKSMTKSDCIKVLNNLITCDVY